MPQEERWTTMSLVVVESRVIEAKFCFGKDSVSETILKKEIIPFPKLSFVSNL